MAKVTAEQFAANNNAANNGEDTMTDVLTETIAATETETVTEERASVGRPKMQLDLDLIVSAHEGGYNAQEIADLLAGEGTPVCAATVRTRLKEAGVALKRGARSAEIDAEEIRDLYVTQGLTLADVADALEVSIPTLRKHMATHGIEARKRGRRAAEKPAELEGTVELEAAAE
jgi:DNA-directed RNA polymerase specialized sigma24 family protein